MYSGFGRELEDDFDQYTSFAPSDHITSGTDSESELKEVEELLYSQVHYMSNTSYKDINGSEADEIVVTFVESEMLEKETGFLIGNMDDPQQMNIIENADRKSKSKGRIEAVTIIDLDDDAVTPSKCVSSDQVHSSTAVKSSKLPKSVKASKCFTSTTVTSTCKKPVYVSSSSSDSSYDAFFFDCDNSPLDCDTGIDDTKINFVSENSTVAKLKNILKSLPDCLWDSIDYDKSNDMSKRLKGGGARYYQMKAFCVNCRTYGHLASACTLPKKLYACLLCGKRGHMARSCSELLCFLCNLSGHSSRECPNRKRRYERCLRCGFSGHLKLACPDLWRQYHLTTNGAKVIAGDETSNNVMFCYNCAGKGHFGHDCKEERMDRRSSATFPFIVKYDGVPGEQPCTPGVSKDKSRSYNNKYDPANVDSTRDSIKKFAPQSKSTTVDLRNVISFRNSQLSNGNVHHDRNVGRTTPVLRLFGVEQDFPRNPSRPEKRPYLDKSISRKEVDNDRVKSNQNRYLFQNPSDRRQAIGKPTEDSVSMRKISGKRKHCSDSVTTCDSSPSGSSYNISQNVSVSRPNEAVKTAKKEKTPEKNKFYGKQKKLVAENEVVELLSSEESLRIKLAKHQARRKEQRKKRHLRKERAKQRMDDANRIALTGQSETSVKQKSPGTPVQQNTVIKTERGFRFD